MTTYEAVMPPMICRGRNWRAYRPGPRPARALPVPYRVELQQVAHRDPVTGRFARMGDRGGRVKLPPRQTTADLRFMKLVTVWQDGVSEVSRVRCRVVSARAARLRGELTATELRSFETDLADALLNDLNPTARQSWELEQMHGAHRTDKAKRGHVSKRRNADARALQPKAPTFQYGASINISRADLLELLSALPDDASSLSIRIRKASGRPASLEVQNQSIKLHTVKAS